MAVRRKIGFERKIKIPLEGYGYFVYVWRGISSRLLEEFSVGFRAEYEQGNYLIRRHCWTKHQDKFHTHVRIGLGRYRWKKIYPPFMKGGLVRALNWSKHDMINNWYKYWRYFYKIIRKNIL